MPDPCCLIAETVVTIGPVALGVGAGVLVVVVWAWLVLRRRARLSRRVQQLKSNWGREDESPRDFVTLREFLEVSQAPATESGWSVDDSTWGDLNMDAIYGLVDRTCSTPGGCRLYQILRNPAMSKEALAKRAELIALLGDDEATRQAIQVELLGVGRSNARGLISLIFRSAPVQTEESIYFVLTAASVAFLVGVILGGGPLMLLGMFVVFVTNLAVHSRTKTQLMGRLDALRQLGGLIRAAEQIGRLKHPQIVQYAKPLHDAAQATRRIARKVSTLLPEGSSTGDLAAMGLEYLSIYFLHEVRTFHSVMGQINARRLELQTLFGLVGELDAWQSIASFRAGMEQYCEPEFIEEGPRLELRDVRHPLLKEAVPNSIEIRSQGIAITGSNMSGKTTFLRTVGVSVLLAQTICTCRAVSYRGRFMKIMASMDESDDLLEGKSYYLVEAERLLQIVRESEKPEPVLALIDEPLAGTNSPQRLAASREILRYLVSHNALAMVCTHDVELVAQLQKPGYFQACHFSDLADEQGIRFDYRLRRGLDYHGNAIRVLKYLGYPDAILEGAMEEMHAVAMAADAANE